MIKVSFAFFFFYLLSSSCLYSQEVSVQLGSDQIAVNQAFTIMITIQNTPLERYSSFPEIQGFVKRGTSSSSSTNYINGKRTSSQSITQNYQPTTVGTFTLSTFKIAINGITYQVTGKKIVVGAAKQRRQTYDPFGKDPFQDLFGNQNASQEFIEVEANAFLALTTDKSAIYPGEGFTMTFAFYLSSKNKAEMRFHNLSEQLPKLLKKIKPANSWEENFNIENITGQQIKINSEAYTQFKIYQGTYYPLNNDSILIPKIGLDMVKYKIAKRRTFFGRNKQEEIITFYTKPKKITFKKLPPHPLQERVSVGNYQLKEKTSSNTLTTGESFNYEFQIVGEGNISGINEPMTKNNTNFDIYSPSIQQDIRRSNGKIKGNKSFTYYAIPNEPGDFSLSDYFQFIFFNPKSNKYDTLKSELILHVKGESKKNEHIISYDMGAFYDNIDQQDNTLTSVDERKNRQSMINLLIFVMIGVVVFAMFKK